MSRSRFTIASLMAIMIPLALGLVALREATQFWVDIVFNLVVASLLLATYKAKCSQGKAGACWTGFAAFAWAHLVLGMPWAQNFDIFPRLATSMAVDRVGAYLMPDTSAGAVRVMQARFHLVHSLLSLPLGMIGALTFGLFAGRGKAGESSAM